MRKGFLLISLLLGFVISVLITALREPAQVDWLMSQGDLHLFRKEYAQAVAFYEEVLEVRPRAALPCLRLGQIYLAQGRYEEAETEFSGAHSLAPGDDEALVGLGDVAAGLGQREEAMERWKEALMVNPANARAHRNLGMAYLGSSQWAAARGELEQAARYGDEGSYYYLGLLLAREDREAAALILEEVSQGDSEWAGKASQALLALEGLDEDKAKGATQLGQLYLSLGLSALAKEEFQEALSLDPEQHLARSYLGYVLWSLGEQEEGLRTLAQAVRLQPDSALNYYFWGLIHRSQGDLEVALLEFRKALRLDPKNAALCAEMAATYEERRDYLAAREWYKAAVERAPQEADFHLLRAQFHLRHLLWVEEGLAAAQRAAALEPQNSLAWDLLGWAQYLVRRPEEARASLERAVALDPESASAYYHLGVVYAQEGRREEARGAYQRAMDLDKEGFLRERAQRSLRELER